MIIEEVEEQLTAPISRETLKKTLKKVPLKRDKAPTSNRPEPSQPYQSPLDRLSAELAAGSGPSNGTSKYDEKDTEELDALLDKLSKQLENDPEAWSTLVAGAKDGQNVEAGAATANGPGGSKTGAAPDGRTTAPPFGGLGLTCITPEKGFAIKTTVTEVQSQPDGGAVPTTASEKGKGKEKEISRSLLASEPDLDRPTPVSYPPLVSKVARIGMKVFINVCHSSEIPAPPPATDAEIREAMQCADEAAERGWKIPMSIGDPKEDKDKAGAQCLIFSVCVHTSAFQRAQADHDFKVFLSTLALQWVEHKNGLKLDDSKVVLPKLKSKGDVVSHWIGKESKRVKISEVPLDLPSDASAKSASAKKTRVTISPHYFIVDIADGVVVSEEGANESVETKSRSEHAKVKPTHLKVVIYLPGVKSLGPSARLHIEKGRTLHFEYEAPISIATAGPSPSPYYNLALPLNHTVDPMTVVARFSRKSELCRVRMAIRHAT